MTEILTESFCERCGTRYTFEPVGSKRKPLSKIGTLGRGLKHFVVDSGTSLDEALRKLAKTMIVQVAHVTPITGGFLVGGTFEQPLTYQEFTALVM